MLRSLLADPHYKLTALLLAVLAWLYVQSDEVATGQVKAQIEWTLADDLVSVTSLPRTVALSVRGTRAAIRRAQATPTLVAVDLSDAGPGEHTLDLAPFPIRGLDGSIEVLSRSPAGTRVQLDERATRKVELSARTVGSPADGFAVQAVTLSPAVAEVTGPATLLAELASLATEPIDVSDAASSFAIPVALALPSVIDALSGAEVQAEVEIIALNERRVFEDVFVYTAEQHGVASPQRARVELAGPSGLVRAIRPQDVAVFVHAPDDGAQPYQARWKSGTDGPVRVLHGAGPQVRVSALEPNRFEVTR